MSARKLLTESRICEMVDASLALPDSDRIPDFRGQQPLVEGEVSRLGSRVTDAFAPLFDQVDWSPDGMASGYAKRYAQTARTLAAMDLANHLKNGVGNLKQEAATAGVDLPTFTRQLLMTITRVYPKLYTLQLFGVIPLQGPTGRLIFKDRLFDNAYTGSTPTIAVGDRTDDLTKWNPDFFKAPEGQLANKIRSTYKKLDISTNDYRVLSEWSDSYADDVQSVYDDNADASEAEARAWNMARLIDRLMLAALVANVPSAATINFTLQPLNNPNYSQLSPSEKMAYDEGIYRDGLVKVQSQINIARKYGDDSMATWGVCGNDFAYSISRLTSMFKPTIVAPDQLDIEAGGIRDLGNVISTGMRIIVDPALTVGGSTNVCILGHRPATRGAVGLYWAPYVNAEPTRDFYDPNLGLITKGTRSRFGIVQPATGTEPASSQLADIYGMLKCI